MTFRNLRLRLSLGVILGASALIVFVLLRAPSHNRDWKIEYAILPKVAVAGDLVTVRNIRNFTYAPNGTVLKASYYHRTYDVSTLTSVWYGISHFYGFGLAHTFLSFGFEGDRYLALSIEARQEIGESYHPINGLLRDYELMYVVGDERDIVGLRTHSRSEKVYLYRINVSKEVAKEFLFAMFQTVNDIYSRPQFYNTLTDNCTTSILKHAKKVSFWDRNFNYKALLPGYSDELAYDLGVISNDRSLQELRERAFIDPGRIAIDDPQFSLRIRKL